MLELSGITKSFIQRGMVLDGLDLSINDGDTISITGPSGSGKTTLLNLIGLLDQPDSGSVIFKGRPITGFTENEAARYRNTSIGFVFQDHLLMPHLSILQNVMLPALAGSNGKDAYRQTEPYAKTLMEIAGISGLAGKYPSQVSGGEAQRAALVRALVNKPQLLLADEPTGSLDSENAEILGKLLLDINRETGTALLLVTHSGKMAEKMNRKYRLLRGKLSE